MEVSRRKFLEFLGAVCAAPAVAKATQQADVVEEERDEYEKLEWECKEERISSLASRTDELSNFEKPIVFFEKNGMTRRASYEELFDGSVNGWDSFAFEDELK